MMRQQYHFKKVGDDIYIWDIRKLLSEYSDLPKSKIPLRQIKELDEPYWYQETVELPTCRSVAMHAQLIDECSLEHPILLHSDGSVMDGMHRVCKALILGHEYIDAIQPEIVPPPDYVNVAAADLPYG